MRRFALALFAATTVASLALVAPSTHAARRGSAATSDPWSYARQCALNADDGVLSVQFMVDVSKSLVENDKTDQRRTLLGEWLLRLDTLAGQGAKVRVAIGSYGSVWTPKVDWVDLTKDSLGLVAAAAGSLPKDEIDTDHVGALLGASASLDSEAKRLATAGKTPCPMLLWFTDGLYDFDSGSPRFRASRGLPPTVPYSPLVVNATNEAAIMQAGLALACGADGTVVQLRKKRTAIVTVALGDRDFRLVNELATGNGFPDGDASGGCDLPTYALGTFNPPPPPPSPPPPPDPCAGGKCESALPVTGSPLAKAGQLTVSLVNTSGNDVGTITQLDVRSPDGHTASLKPTSGKSAQANVATATVTVSELGSGGILVNIEAGDGNRFDGEWQVTAQRSEATTSLRSEWQLITDFRPRLVSPPEVRADAATPVTAELVSGAGTPLASDLASLVTLQLHFPELADDPGFDLVAGADGRFTGEIPANLLHGAEEHLTLQLQPSTNEPVELDDVTVQLPVRWPGFPVITFPAARNGVVRPAIFDTPGEVTVSYVIDGPATGEGCVTPKTEQVSSTGGAAAAIAYSVIGEDCVGASAHAERTMTLRVDRRYEGSWCGDAVFTLKGHDDPHDRESRQTVCLATERGANAFTEFLAVLAMFLGAALPFGLLLATNRISGRIPHAVRFRAAQIAVVHDHLGLHQLDGSGLLDDASFDSTDIKLDRRGVSAAQGRVAVEARAAIPAGELSPFSLMLLTGPKNFLLRTGQPIVLGKNNEILFQGILDATREVPLGLDGLWMLVPSFSQSIAGRGAPAAATLVVFRVIGDGSTVYNLDSNIRSALTSSEFQRFMRQCAGENADVDVDDGF